MDGMKEKILELASQDKELARELGTAESVEMAAETLRARGIDIAVEDLQALVQPEAEGKVKLSEDELEAVAGGEVSDESVCVCLGAGYGGGDNSCACVVGGYGSDSNGDDCCFCFGEGEGAA